MTLRLHREQAPLVGQEAIGVLTEYLNAAMRRAEYEELPEGEGWYGHIVGVQGVYARAPTREETAQELRSALEDWLLFGLVNGFPIPALDGIELKATRVA
jgi:predicted RNase H-like HicB family nuclease